MSQSFSFIPPEERLVSSRGRIVNNFMSVASNNSGTAIPQYDRDMMQIGMTYYNTTLKQLMILVNKGETELGDVWDVMYDNRVGGYNADVADVAKDAQKLQGREVGQNAGNIPVLNAQGLIPSANLGQVDAYTLRGQPPGVGPNNILQLDAFSNVPNSTLKEADVKSVGGRVPGNASGNLAIIGGGTTSNNLSMDLQGVIGEIRYIWASTADSVRALIGNTWAIADGTNGTPNLLYKVLMAPSSTTTDTGARFTGNSWTWYMSWNEMPQHAHYFWIPFDPHNQYNGKNNAPSCSQGGWASNTGVAGGSAPITYNFPRAVAWPIIKLS